MVKPVAHQGFGCSGSYQEVVKDSLPSAALVAFHWRSCLRFLPNLLNDGTHGFVTFALRDGKLN